MLRENCRVGMRVHFGRDNGEKSLGEVVKVNPARAKVRLLEERGAGRGSNVGTVWTVPYSLMNPTDHTSTAPVPNPTPNPADQPFPYKMGLYAENAIMEVILITYGELSPENLTCDGELPQHIVRARHNQLIKRLHHLFGALGRPVSETVAYEWQKEHLNAFSASH